MEWHNWLDDGGFEAGVTPVEIGDVTGLSRATAERSQAAARMGSWGYALSAGPGEAMALSLKAYTEKGDDVRFSFWARSLEGELSLQPTVYGMGPATQYRPEPLYTPDSVFPIGHEWTEVSFETYLKEHEAVLLSLEVGPDATLHVDDVQIAQHIWRMAEYPGGESRTEDVPTYIGYDEASGEPIYSDLFLQDLQHWDDVLTDLIDPLIAEGYLQWTSLPEMGELYRAWEDTCAARQ